MSEEFDNEVVMHCKRCGEHWTVDEYDADYDPSAKMCPECLSDEDTEVCMDSQCRLSSMEPVGAYSDFLAKEILDDQGKLVNLSVDKWNEIKLPGLGEEGDGGYIPIVYGYDSKAKDAKMAIFICPDGRLKAAQGSGSSACLPWFKSYVTPGVGQRANASTFPEIFKKFKEEAKTLKLKVVTDPNLQETLKNYGRDVTKTTKVSGGSSKLAVVESELAAIKEALKAKGIEL